MKLEQKLKSINSRKIQGYINGQSKNIHSFWDEFIAPSLPSKTCVLDWNKLLMDYVNEQDAVYAVRAFSNWNVSDVETEKDDELRRGFFTTFNNEKFSYFVTDNFFVAYFQKMVKDDYCPNLKEFKEMIINLKFPARFGRSCLLERVKAAYKIDAIDPGISKAGYKIAHIIDVGTKYLVDGKSKSITELSEQYGFSRGKYSDWNLENHLNKKVYIRRSQAQIQTREIMKAHFLRFVNPFNYFLSPKAKYKNKVYNHFNNNLTHRMDYDIAEYEPLLDFVHTKFVEIYGEPYKEYLKQLLLPNDYFKESNGNEVIDIRYGNPIFVENSAIQEDSDTNISESFALDLVMLYLIEGYSYKKIESELLNLDAETTRGWRAMKLLRDLSITSDMKGNLNQQNINDWLNKTEGRLKNLMIQIKQKNVW
jgi:hypothetical protein